ncbi:hypothetical protein O6H91_12G047800 [Diphasiastrum complanatum]|uniref:Uncharacterized protein n=1 Tax=Diphasiastrum complanatum TaxID=34168 RepID=A0ACC2C1E1_DIPCM|nr:hypothetical protein O6H91_12G047800 [Diphasiastrum complanatum]
MKETKMPEEGEPLNKSLLPSISSTVSKVKNQVLADRVTYIKARLEANSCKLQSYIAHAEEVINLRAKLSLKENDPGGKDMLNTRIQKALCKFGGSADGALSEMETVTLQEEGCISSPIVFGSASGTKSVVRPVKLPSTQKIPPYTTWIFLDRNQRMAEDQSVVGRRRIYYDSAGNEALICSDSEEEQIEEEEDKHDFTKGDDFVVRGTIEEHGLNKSVLKLLADCIGARGSEVEARYEVLRREFEGTTQAVLQEKTGTPKSSISQSSSPPSEFRTKNDPDILESPDTHRAACMDDDKFLAKDLSSAMDSFDKLFCRRCLVFDCRLHGCSQPVVLPSDRQPAWSNPEPDMATPCGPQCWLLMKMEIQGKEHESTSIGADAFCKGRGHSASSKRSLKSHSDPGKLSNAGRNECVPYSATTSTKGPAELAAGRPSPKQRDLPRKGIKDKRLTVLRRLLKRNVDKTNRGETKDLCQVKHTDKTSETLYVETADTTPKKSGSTGFQEPSSLDSEVVSSSKQIHKSRAASRRGDRMLDDKPSRKRLSSIGESRAKRGEVTGVSFKVEEWSPKLSPESKSRKNSPGKDCFGGTFKPSKASSWSPLERGLFEKGIQIFGRNSCLIARNLLKGLKSCAEVGQLMNEYDTTTHKGLADGSKPHVDGNGKWTLSNSMDAGPRSRLYNGRRKGRVRKLKYTWKSAGRPAIKKRIADGKDQPCRQYTPCSCLFTCGKQCSCMRNGTCCEKYCGCSKVCKNRFRGCHCAKSQCCSRQCPCFAAGRECDPDVCRNCWIGCGDGTSGGPAQRGDNYECHNMKLLLKQQQRVLLGKSDVAGWGAFLKNSVSKHDYLGEYTGELISHREADKRGKIYDRENSSFLFNLNDQVIMVAGDHRVGIFAKERIAAGEELFYDYRYEPDRAPVWARKPEDLGFKQDDLATASGRSQKNA